MVVAPGSHGCCTLEQKLKAPVVGVLVGLPGLPVALRRPLGLSANVAPALQAPLSSCCDLPHRSHRVLLSHPAIPCRHAMGGAPARHTEPRSFLGAHLSHPSHPAPIARLQREVRHLTPAPAAAASGVGLGHLYEAM